MKLTQTVETFGQENQSWLASAHGTDSARTVTLDVSTFNAAHYANGYIPSGIALGKITTGGKYGPYDDTAADGRAVLVGFLFTSQPVDLTSTATPIIAPLLDHGKVISALLPFQSGQAGRGYVDAAGIVDVAGRIQVL